ncbi:MAG: cell division protein FtsZ [Verrucomicrobiota bacterium]
MKNSTDANGMDAGKKKSLRIFGVGGAGCNALDFMTRDASWDATFIALNTDAQSLAMCCAPEKLCLGGDTTYGLGAGGDPEVGRAAAEGESEKLRELCEGAKLVVVVAGMGGGTGTGASAILARVAKEAGAQVLCVVTLPFEFESGRRQRQALLGFQQLRSAADAVICLPNQKVFQLIDAQTTVLDAFNVANRSLAEGVFGVARLLTRTGLINADFADLAAVASGFHAETCFASAEAAGENRSQLVLEKLLTHPLLDGGKVLEDADSLLVSLCGGMDLTMSEVNSVMREINRHCDNAHVIFSAAIEEAYSNRLSVTLVASGKSVREEKISPAPRAAKPALSAPAETPSQWMESSPNARPASRIVAPAPEMTEERKEQLLTRQNGSRPRKTSARMRQNELPLEIISKGRFEKSEPTIHRGEDLDLPTYIRRGIALN